MGMAKKNCHPNAYLSNIRNVQRGLRTRTLILNVLENGAGDPKTIGGKAQLHYRVVIHHLRLLKTAGIVEQKMGNRPRVWRLTGVGQKRLVNSY